MINKGQLREYVIRPALGQISLWTLAAEQLVYGTGATESRYTFIDQTTPGPGPAYGFWQMEEPTYLDIWTLYLPSQVGLRDALLRMVGHPPGSRTVPSITTLHGNMFFAAAMCRVHYRRVQKALPEAGDALGMAQYWKTYYNTRLGAGTVEKALPFFQEAIAA